MARIDIPVLQCDRCKRRTSDMGDMATYIQLTQSSVSEREKKVDLCSTCTAQLNNFMMGRATSPAELLTE